MTWDDVQKLLPYMISLAGLAWTERTRQVVREEMARELKAVEKDLAHYAKREDLIRLETLTQQVKDDIVEIKQMLKDTLGRG